MCKPAAAITASESSRNRFNIPSAETTVGGGPVYGESVADGFSSHEASHGQPSELSAQSRSQRTPRDHHNKWWHLCVRARMLPCLSVCRIRPAVFVRPRRTTCWPSDRRCCHRPNLMRVDFFLSTSKQLTSSLIGNIRPTTRSLSRAHSTTGPRASSSTGSVTITKRRSNLTQRRRKGSTTRYGREILVSKMQSLFGQSRGQAAQ